MTAPDETTLFDCLATRQLVAAVTAIRGQSIDRITAIDRDEPPGGCRGYGLRKDFARVGWRAGAAQGTLRLVAKVSPPGTGEADRYRALGRQVHLPRVAICEARDGEELLVMERLHRIGFDEQAPAAVDDFVEALAGLNAIRPLGSLPAVDLESWSARTLATLPELVDECATGRHGEACAVEARRWPAGREAWLPQRLEACVQELCRCPWGVVHLDPAPQNCGRRRHGAGIVFFDLQTTGRGPLVADCARWSDAVLYGEARADELLRRWCRALQGAGGPGLQPADARRWADAVQPLRIGRVLGWFRDRLHDGRADFTDDREAARATFRGWVRELLAISRRCLLSG